MFPTAFHTFSPSPDATMGSWAVALKSLCPLTSALSFLGRGPTEGVAVSQIASDPPEKPWAPVGPVGQVRSDTLFPLVPMKGLHLYAGFMPQFPDYIFASMCC